MTFDIIKSAIISALLTALIALVAQATTYTFGVTGTATSGGGGGGALPGSLLPAHPGGGNWAVAFNDEFDGSPGMSGVAGGTGGSGSINTNKWHVWPDGGQLGFMCGVLNSTITIAGGIMTMPKADGASCGGHKGSYIETGQTSLGTGTFGPGYYEARIQLDTDGGQSQQAFWMTTGWGNTLADAFEADYPEAFGCSAADGYIVAPGGNQVGTVKVQLNNVVSTCPDFHIFGFQYVAFGPLIYYFDGTEMARTNSSDPGNGSNAGNNFNFSVILDDAGSGSDPGSSAMHVDWFRYYR